MVVGYHHLRKPPYMVIIVTIVFPQIKTETSGSPSPLQVVKIRDPPRSPRAWQVPRAV